MTTIRTIQHWSKSAEAPAQTAVFFSALLIGSLPTSPFLLSISMWGLVVVGFWQRARTQNQAANSFGHRAWLMLKESFQLLFQNRAYTFLLLLLLLPALSGLWSEDTGYWLERTRVRLPFLVLPWVFANLPPLSSRQLRLVLYILVWFFVLLCIGVGINFFLHYNEIMLAMYQGRPMPVPRNHIRFSLILATAVIAGGRLWYEGFTWRYSWERKALAIAVVFLFIFIHFLSVRSGLAVLYAVLFFTLIRYIWLTRRWKPALALFALLLLAPYIALKTMPSLEQKIDYMVYDWKRYINNEGENYSDAERWVSLKSGWLIWQTAPWLGVGAGDLRQETERLVKEHFPHYERTPKLPHNQFLYILAGTGIVGLGFSLLAFLYPVFHQRRKQHYLFAAFQVMIFMSFLVEYTIETAMGVAWYLFFTLWFILLSSTPDEHS